MATFNTPIITNQGLEFLKSAVAGHDRLTFSNIVFSAQDLSNESDDDIAKMDDLTDKDMVNAPTTMRDKLTGELKIRSVGYNTSTSQAFYIRTYGLYATNQAGKELLIAVAIVQEPDFVPANNGKQVNQLTYTFNFNLSSTNNIQFSDEHDIDVTQADLDSIKDAVNDAQSVVKNIDLSSVVKQANSYTDKSINSYANTNQSQMSSALSSAGSVAVNNATNALNSANSYTNSKTANATQDARNYIDSKTADATRDVHNYTDNAIKGANGYTDSAIENANKYADSQDNQALKNANAYSDSKATNAVTTANGYTDTAIKNLDIDDKLKNAGFRYKGLLSADDDLNDITDAGTYFVHLAKNAPSNYGIMIVYNTNSQFKDSSSEFIQEFINMPNGYHYERIDTDAYTNRPWYQLATTDDLRSYATSLELSAKADKSDLSGYAKVSQLPDMSGYAKQQDFNNTIHFVRRLSSGEDLTKIRQTGIYELNGASNLNNQPPASVGYDGWGYGFMEAYNFGGAVKAIFHSDFSQVAFETNDITNPKNPWIKLATTAQIDDLQNKINDLSNRLSKLGG